MAKALIVKEDGLIYAAEVPEEPKRWDYEADYYEKKLASAKESAVLVSDQEKAKALLSEHHFFNAYTADRFRKPGIYPIPDLQWEVDDSHNPEKQGYTYGGGYAADMMAYNGPVAILKESTPSTEQESQEELWDEATELCQGEVTRELTLSGNVKVRVYHVIDALKKHYNITRKP